MKSKVTVKTCTKSKDKRVWDKRHSVFTAVSLKQTFQDICRGSTWRWQSWHMPLAALWVLKKGRVFLKQLRNKGDLKHNSKVLQKGRGEVVIWKQPSNKALVGNYLPCCYCFGMFSKKILWKHQSLCKSKKIMCGRQLKNQTKKSPEFCCTPASIKFHLKDVRLYVPSPRPHP